MRLFYRLHCVSCRQVFVAIALILGDGLYNFVKITALTLGSLHKNWKNPLPINNGNVNALMLLFFVLIILVVNIKSYPHQNMVASFYAGGFI